MSDAGSARSAALSPRTRTIIALGLIGLLVGFLWGVSDVPRYSATASVLVDGKGGVPADQIQLAAAAERARGAEVADRAAALLGGDVAGADLLSDITAGTDSDAGSVEITADAESPDFAAAAANGFADALVDIGGRKFASGAEAAIPSSPSENRSAVTWSLIGLVLGLLAGAVITAARGPRAAASRPIFEEALEDEEVEVMEPEPDFDFPAREPDQVPEPAERPVPEPAELPEPEPKSEPEPEPVLAEDAFGVPVVASFADPAEMISREDGVHIDRTAAGSISRLAEELGIGAEDSPHRIAILDVEAGDGSLEVLIGLAIEAGSMGLSAIVVEGDLEHPTLAELVGVRSAPGLRDYLRGASGPRDVLRSARLASGEGLVCVPAGEIGSPLPEGVDGERFAALMARLPKVYDLVLVSAPPAETDEAATIAALMDDVAVAAADEDDAGPAIAAAVAGLPQETLVAGILTRPQSRSQSAIRPASSVKR